MNAAEIKKQLEILEQAKAPVIILGGGVVLFGAVDECIGFAEYMQIPVSTTYMVRKVYLTMLTLMDLPYGMVKNMKISQTAINT